MVHSWPLCPQAENAIQNSSIEPRNIISKRHIWLNSTYDSGVKPTKGMFGKTHSFTISTPDSIETGHWYKDLSGVFDIIVCDEAHHGINEQEKIFKKWPDAQRVGITATPELVKSRSKFNEFYSDLASPKSFIHENGGKNWKALKKILIKKEYLSDYGKVIDKHIEHEADKIHLELEINVPWKEQTSSIIVARKLSSEMLEEGCKRILLFVDGVPQARAIAGFFRDNGIKTSAVYGTLKRDERTSRINGFASGHFQVLVSVDILREGIDVPLVDGILIMRKGLSKEGKGHPMFTQMLGRGLRGPRSLGTKKCLVWHVI
mgnify:CR=1 FL=1